MSLYINKYCKYTYIFIPRTQPTSIFEGQPSKTRPFSIKTGVIWVLGIYIYLICVYMSYMCYKICNSTCICTVVSIIVRSFATPDVTQFPESDLWHCAIPIIFTSILTIFVFNTVDGRSPANHLLVTKPRK